ncbi:MAG: hypothetical protein HY549_08995 [Elusimicrobia bacterium]|nr:hypothetical protein [Elusimicrobiota bacterium]
MRSPLSIAICLGLMAGAAWAQETPSAAKEDTAPQTETAVQPQVEASDAEMPSEPANEAHPAAPAERPLFSGSWKDANVEERSAFLEASPELKVKVQEKWDKSNPKQRQQAVKNHPLLGKRSLKHKWADATPEEKAAFLNSLPEVRQRVKESWDLLTPEQRTELVLKRPSARRNALHHGWSEATREERLAFVESQPDIRSRLSKMWQIAAAAQGKAWAEAGDDKMRFFELSLGIQGEVENRWKKLTPAQRAQAVNRWPHWKLRKLGQRKA